MGQFTTSDYGSGSSINSSSSSWLWREKSAQTRPKSELWDMKSYTHLDMLGKSTVDDVKREFQMNGSDSPYNPDEDKTWTRLPASGVIPGELSGLGPAAQYLRQKSWPEPERSPAPRLPRPRSLLEPRWSPPADLWQSAAPEATEPTFATSTPVYDDLPVPPFLPDAGSEVPTAEQYRVLHSLPDSVVFSLLRNIRASRRNKQIQECRFCKNNGEQQAFYRSHCLKDGSGRVTCPVLRAFTCRRCGARGDAAHTIKYCPLTTNQERVLSEGMMRSIRTASSRRRHSLAPSVADDSNYLIFGETASSTVNNSNFFNNCGELDPQWAALEQKLSLF